MTHASACACAVPGAGCSCASGHTEAVALLELSGVDMLCVLVSMQCCKTVTAAGLPHPCWCGPDEDQAGLTVLEDVLSI